VGLSGSATAIQRPVRWHDGRITDLGTLGGTDGLANAINDRGDVAGWADSADGRLHAAVWRRGRAAVDLGPDMIVNASDSHGRLAGWVPIMNSQALFWR